VHTDYVEEVDDEALIQGAIDGMLASLDPHSTYLDAKALENLMTQTEGEYGGLGLNVTQEDGVVKVIAATEDTPAFKAGIKAGDLITRVDGKVLYGGELDEAVAQMRGDPGTTVKLTIFRPGTEKPFDVSVKRAIIALPAVKWEIKDRVGILNVNSFNKTTTKGTIEAMAAIEKALGGPPLGYVLDLRSNPGGLLNEAVDLSDLFLTRGEVVSQRGRGRASIERYFARPGDAANGLPVVVLVDAGSASASEIVAGALQDQHRALVMGERSFGKGSVQTLVPLSADTAIKLTTARYYTPSGRSLQEGGIMPDITVPQLSDPDYKSRPKFREADLRRHLINEIKDESVMEDDDNSDPRFAETADQLKKQGVEDFQLQYAVRTIARLGAVKQAAAPARRTGRR
jgi:carboxyl-terminal processing protease